jgi:hypothetical protein
MSGWLFLQRIISHGHRGSRGNPERRPFGERKNSQDPHCSAAVFRRFGETGHIAAGRSGTPLDEIGIPATVPQQIPCCQFHKYDYSMAWITSVSPSPGVHIAFCPPIPSLL